MALPAEKQIDPGKFPEKVRRFVSPDSPPPMRMMLARGLVPMKPLVQMCALYQLAQGADADVASTARDSAKKIPVATVGQIASQPLIPLVLDWMTDVYRDQQDIVRAVLLNRLTDIDTLVRVAEKADEETCEVIARNQQRLLESAQLVRALYMNRSCRASTADRVVDFAARNGLDLSSIPGHKEILAAIHGEDIGSKTEAELAAEDEVFRAVTLLDDFPEDFDADISAPESAAARRADEQGEEAEPQRKGSAAGRIRDMNIAQKVRLAMMGNSSERAILIKDSNKMVSRAVIRSPALTDNEVYKFANNKALDEEIIGFIARRKKWTRHYRLKKALCLNPKTPLSVALNFLAYLRLNDLREVARSRGTSPGVAKAAKAAVKRKIN